MDPRNVVLIVDGLDSKHLVKRAVDPSDRRRRLLGLTSNGRGVAVTAREPATLNQLLQKLRSSLAGRAPH